MEIKNIFLKKEFWVIRELEAMLENRKGPPGVPISESYNLVCSVLAVLKFHNPKVSWHPSLPIFQSCSPRFWCVVLWSHCSMFQPCSTSVPKSGFMDGHSHALQQIHGQAPFLLLLFPCVKIRNLRHIFGVPLGLFLFSFYFSHKVSQIIGRFHQMRLWGKSDNENRASWKFCCLLVLR